MKVWHVFRTDGNFGYDEYDGHIVAADTQEEVVSMLDKKFSGYFDRPSGSWWADANGKATWEIEEITEPGVVLSSFNAG